MTISLPIYNPETKRITGRMRVKMPTHKNSEAKVMLYVNRMDGRFILIVGEMTLDEFNKTHYNFVNNIDDEEEE